MRPKTKDIHLFICGLPIMCSAGLYLSATIDAVCYGVLNSMKLYKVKRKEILS